MTWYGSPVVYKLNDVVVIAPRIKENILEEMRFEKVFEFCGPWHAIRVKDKKTMLFDDLFGDSRMARLNRIALDLDTPLQEYIKKKAADKIEHARLFRKNKIVAAKGLIIEAGIREYITCPYPKCGRRYNWQHPSYLVGRCPRWNSKITLVKTRDDKYLIRRLEIDKA